MFAFLLLRYKIFFGDKTRISRVHRCAGRKTSVGGKGKRVKEIGVGGYGGERKAGKGVTKGNTVD